MILKWEMLQEEARSLRQVIDQFERVARFLITLMPSLSSR